VLINKDTVDGDVLNAARVFVIAGSREKFTASELDAIRRYLDDGGSLLVLMGEGGETRSQTNINYLLEQFGISINNDVVVRSHFYKYFHPKEALVSNGVLNRAVSQYAGKSSGTLDEDTKHSQSLTFVYPFGATLSVAKPAVAVLSTGSVSYPLNRPVCAFYKPKGGKGKLAVLGSCHMFGDLYIDKEENSKILDVIFNFLTTDDFQLNQIDADDPEVADYNYLPDTAMLAEQVKSCLQETDEVPRDITALFDSSLYKLDTSLVPKVLKAYEQLKVPHEQLTLITPQFETPLPPLQPAVFPPTFRELPPPMLDLFDLDEHFTSEKARLAQLTNKCSDDDLEYFVRECGDILGISNKLPVNKRSAKDILEHVLQHVVEFKKLNQEHEIGDVPVVK
jgi:intraflagellar transport protein 52